MAGTPSIVMSVVVVAGGGLHGAARTLAHLADQTIARSLELVVVAADRAPLPPQLATRFGAVKQVSEDVITERGVAAFAGLRATSADIVALVEDHAFPDPDWAECLLEAHRGEWVGVGSRVMNANPGSASSWANHVLHYAKFGPAAVAGCHELIPWHNSAYKRTALQPLWDQLATLLTWEGWLQRELRSRGGKLYLVTDTVTQHTNVSTVYTTLAQSLAQGRAIAATRSADGGWSLPRRMLHAMAAPTAVTREWFNALRTRHAAGVPPHHMRPVAALLLAAIGAFALGKMVGYMGGEGNAFALLEEYDLHRRDHLNAADADRERTLNVRYLAQWHGAGELSV